MRFKFPFIVHLSALFDFRIPQVGAHIALSTPLACLSLPAFAFRLGVAGGAVGFGNGHPNAANFTSLANYKMHATFSELDISLASTQFLVGKFFPYKFGTYVIPAAGFVLDANGSGPGVGASFGWTPFCFGVCASIELQNILGVGPHRTLVSGCAARVGIEYTNK